MEPGVVEAVGLVPKGGGAALAAVGHDVTTFDELVHGCAPSLECGLDRGVPLSSGTKIPAFNGLEIA